MHRTELPPDHPASAVFDVFKGQQTGDILAEENIHASHVPANCTDCLQPTDPSVNKSVREVTYAQKVQEVVCFTDAKASGGRGRPSPAYRS